MARIRVISWNLQRLFHFAPSPLSTQITSRSTSGWTESVYRAKIRNVATILRQLSAERNVGLVALAEVENSAVVADLASAAGWTELVEVHDPVAKLDGYDITLLYDPRWLTPVGPPRSHNVHIRFNTRDILEAEFVANDGSELLVLVHHWPSRLVTSSSALRIGLADYSSRLLNRWLKYSVAELSAGGTLQLPGRDTLTARWQRACIMLGDFNDEPFDVSLAQMLCGERSRALARRPLRLSSKASTAVESYLKNRARLYNPSWQLLVPHEQQPPGTTYWNTRWYLLDQVLMSQGLFTEQGVRFIEGSLHIPAMRVAVAEDGTEVELTTRSGKPRRFESETLRGVSDHLPLVFDLDAPDR